MRAIDGCDLVAAIAFTFIITACIAIPVTHGCTKNAWERESIAVGAAEYVMTPDSKLPKWQWKPKAEKAQ